MSVDLRSDTVTKPTPDMRAAIASAPVGDDVHGDDPTVNRLQQRVAELLGKDAALFTPSGTMANGVAIRAVCEPGDEIILDEMTHCYNYESGGFAAMSGVSIRCVHGPRGIFSAQDVQRAMRPPVEHFARSRMVVVENTNNNGGGTAWPMARLEEIRHATSDLGLHLHLDGARLMNACVATGHAPADYTRHVDSVSMCFSKGLGAPVGSIVAGSADFIHRAHRFRKMFGGGMRQAGLLAAAAIHALDHHVERLAEDHANARRLAEALSGLPGITLVPPEIDTNIVIFDIDERHGTAKEMMATLRSRDVLLLSNGPQRLRAVTHLDVSAAQIDEAIAVFRDVFRS